MTFEGINGWAVLAAAIASYVFGSLYYMALAQPWTAAQGWSAEQAAERRAKAGLFPFVLAFVCQVLTAWTLAGVVGHLGPGQVTLRNGAISSLFLWAGLALPMLAANYAFAGRRLRLIVIDAAHWLGVLVVQGAVIGAMGLRK